MSLPFTPEQFLDVFSRYNEAIWPAQLGAYALGVLVVALALRPAASSGRAVGALLAGAWAFNGIAYHLAFFAAVNPAAYVFGGAFLLQAALLAKAAWRDRLAFGFAPTARYGFGLALVAYAAVLYPLLGLAAGHAYPRAPMFGVAPCPTTIFTFGVLLLAKDRVPPWLLVVPFAWSLVGVSAAVQLGIREDLGLAVAGLLAAPWLVLRVRAPIAAAGAGGPQVSPARGRPPSPRW